MGSMMSGLFGGKAPPVPELPAMPPPETLKDTGANIVVGADKAGDQRVSGGGGKVTKSSGGDVLGNLGKSGLSI